MSHEYKSALMLLPRLPAPTRHVSHPEKGQHHHKGQFFLTVQSSACSELLTAREGDKPEENASYPILTKARPSGKVRGSRGYEGKIGTRFRGHRIDNSESHGLIIARSEEMAEEAPGDEEDDASCSAQRRVQ